MALQRGTVSRFYRITEVVEMVVSNLHIKKRLLEILETCGLLLTRSSRRSTVTRSVFTPDSTGLRRPGPSLSPGHFTGNGGVCGHEYVGEAGGREPTRESARRVPYLRTRSLPPLLSRVQFCVNCPIEGVLPRLQRVVDGRLAVQGAVCLPSKLPSGEIYPPGRTDGPGRSGTRSCTRWVSLLETVG